jgi:hypothetical protein
MSVEVWKSIFDVVTVFALFLAFFSGVGVWYTSKIINERQAAQLKQFDLDLTGAKIELGKQQERATKAETDLLTLQEKLSRQGSRVALLYGETGEKFVKSLAPFARQKAEVRVCNLIPKSVFTPLPTDEIMQLAIRLRYLLSDESKWSVNPLVDENCSGNGLTVSVNSKAPKETRAAAKALLDALIAVPLEVVGPAVITSDAPRAPQPPTYKPSGKIIDLAPLDADTVVITVLAHPL